MYDNVRKPESDWYEAGCAAPRTDTAGTGCYDSYWSPSQAAAPKKKPHQGLKITMIILDVLCVRRPRPGFHLRRRRSGPARQRDAPPRGHGR